MMSTKIRSVVLASAVAAILAAVGGGIAYAAPDTRLTGCRYEIYEPEMTPRCGHEEAQLHLPDPPPPTTTTPPGVIYSIYNGEEGGKHEHDRDNDGGGLGGAGARSDRDAAGKPR
jgi:hypothetical protein